MLEFVLFSEIFITTKMDKDANKLQHLKQLFHVQPTNFLFK